MEEIKEDVDERVLQDLYAWVDKAPLSRPKRNLSRDFSDGVLVAEVVAHYYPKMVELHNYTPANSAKQKVDNWHVLNRKVFKKLDFELSEEVVQQVANCKPFVIERLLLLLRSKLERTKQLLDEDGDSGMYSQSLASPSLALHVVSQSPNQHVVNARGPKVGSTTSPVKDTGKIGHAPQQPKKAATAMQSAQNGNAAGLAGDGTPVGKVENRVTALSATVPRLLLEEKEQQCLAQEETIQILQAKVRRLEHLLQLKDIRIEDMQAKLESCTQQGSGTRQASIKR